VSWSSPAWWPVSRSSPAWWPVSRSSPAWWPVSRSSPSYSLQGSSHHSEKGWDAHFHECAALISWNFMLTKFIMAHNKIDMRRCCCLGNDSTPSPCPFDGLKSACKMVWCQHASELWSRCCYITVDSATTALQNGACTFWCSSKQMHYKTLFSHNGYMKSLEFYENNITLFCLKKILFHNIIITQNHAWHITQSGWNNHCKSNT
jgi:hypothetical protein